MHLLQVFCKDYREYSAHRCSNGYFTDCKVLFCPDCGKSIKAFGKDVTPALEQHKAECKPSGSQVQKRIKCPVKGCKETLTTSNRVHCRQVLLPLWQMRLASLRLCLRATITVVVLR